MNCNAGAQSPKAKTWQVMAKTKPARVRGEKTLADLALKSDISLYSVSVLQNWQLSWCHFLVTRTQEWKNFITNFGKRLTICFTKTSLYSLIACMLVELKTNPMLIRVLMIYEHLCLIFHLVYLITSWWKDKKWFTLRLSNEDLNSI